MENVVERGAKVSNGYLTITGELNLKVGNYNGCFILKPDGKKEVEDFTAEEMAEIKSMPPGLQELAKMGRKVRAQRCECGNLRGVVVMHTGDKHHLIKTTSDEESLKLFNKIVEELNY